MEEKPTSVAALASKFNHKTSTTLEKDEKLPRGPIRKKPPCSLPLFGIRNNLKTETDHNGEQKPPINEAFRQPKLKMKNSSALIEKLQATLHFSPTALMPGLGPKSPLKSPFSPFASPASTPESPGTASLSSESDGSVSLDQPKEAEPLQSLHKSRARPSLKRRPPSRRFRRSVTDDVGDPEQQDNAAQTADAKPSVSAEDASDEVFAEDVQISNGEANSSAEAEASTSPRSSTEGEAAPSHSSAEDNVHSSPQSAKGEANPRSSTQGDVHSSHQSAERETLSSPLSTVKGEASPSAQLAESEALSSPRSVEGETLSSPRSSSEGDVHTSPCSSVDLSPEEPARKMPSDPVAPQSQEPEVRSVPDQCENLEENGIAPKAVVESIDKDTETPNSIAHNPAGSETVSAVSRQEPGTEEAKAMDKEPQVANAEGESSGAVE
ncbi:capZ-interacting protein [Amblyraja radiata]|uniref:capZ-interacting protein n=1 Tax=Amblyraja radiata TaxID=386614 RepID=UPI0014036FC5|nr:capZ-interacting protein [Amblyraja radiata]